jgi:hypothetical protein
MGIKKIKPLYEVGTLVLDDWYGLGIIVDTTETDDSGYRNKVKFFYGNNKSNVYNDREIDDLYKCYVDACVRNRHAISDRLQGLFNTRK